MELYLLTAAAFFWALAVLAYIDERGRGRR
jgi:hypothetical protein